MMRRIVTIIAVIALWSVLVNMPILRFTDIPSPLDVLIAARESLSAAQFYADSLVSAGRVLGGFVLAVAVGVPLGLSLGRSRSLHGLIFPALETLRPIPPLAWAPLSVVALPSLAWSITFVTFLGAFFPILVSTVDGARRVDPLHLRAARCLGANRRSTFTEVVWPSTVPVLVSGASMGLGLAWMNLIAAEMIAGGSGIGYALWTSFQRASHAQVVFLMIAIGFVGWLTTTIFAQLGRHAVRWHSTNILEEWSDA